MMEIPSRTEIEAAFGKRMEKLTRSQRKRVRDAMGSPPDPTRVPPSLWEDFRRETEEELLLLIYLVFVASANYHAFGNAAAKVPDSRRIERDTLVTDFEGAASNYSSQRAPAASGSYVNTARDRFAPLVNEHRFAQANNATLTRQQVEDRLAASLGPSRAAGVATTEVTSAQSAGGDTGVAATGGLDDGDQWITQNDQRVCPICGPLHMTRRKTWGHIYPDGPPAHVNCRCTLRYVNA